MKAILVRIGVDHSYGKWNAPIDPASHEFVYVPIPESRGTRFESGCERRYKELMPALHQFAQAVGADLFEDLKCPRQLLDRSMHLDPDFEHLTYGDDGDRRGSHIRELVKDDLLVFYAGLRPCKPCDHKLIYALVGVYVVDEVVEASAVPQDRWGENAHTRKRKRGASDIVVRAKPDGSGRFSRAIPIGEYRDRAYRVRKELLKAWGGLTVNDGYIQRSARPPRFNDAPRFRRWLDRQGATLIRANNPSAANDRVVVVHLRQPEKSKPNEMRSDPFWEFGSFGCTKCHQTNLMHPDRIDEMEGVRLAFAQGGPLGFRLVLLTPPVHVVRHNGGCELRWTSAERPFRYGASPRLVDADGESDFPALLRMICGANRTTAPAQFSSKFRSRRKPLPSDVAAELCSKYQHHRTTAPRSALASGYEQAMPFPPNLVDQNRKQTYERFVRRLKGRGSGGCSRKC